ncbi:hypothetical protein BZG16_29980, partial [Escherichia coli]|nr:hypothetical protein [Escherichia coli]
MVNGLEILLHILKINYSNLFVITCLNPLQFVIYLTSDHEYIKIAYVRYVRLKYSMKVSCVG